MARNIFVSWNKANTPTFEEVSLILEDYLSGVGTVEVRGDFLLVTLHGKISCAFRRIHGYESKATAMEEMGATHPRFFEVYFVEEGIRVVTRMADELTNAIAEGFAAMILHFKQGELLR